MRARRREGRKRVTTVEAFFEGATAIPEDQLREDLVQMIRARHEATPRHRQVELGPSDVAHPCMRRLAYGLMQVPRANSDYDPLPSIIGVATHTWLESACEHANGELGRERWVPESRVNVAKDLSGSSDVYDRLTQTVIDWKVPGYTRFTAYKKDPGPVYRQQVQFYGLGFENAGLPVKQVAIAFIPRAGTLSKMHLWKTDYSREMALAGLARRDATIALINDLRVEENPEAYQWIPAKPYDCSFCKWWRPEPSSPLQCKGEI
jgi:hypothetical protein